jgi:uncharacterized glyoxalase superfamily protein PhnB
MEGSSIVAPVMRSIAVADIERSAAFYCGVLGFESRDRVEVVSGPARIRFDGENSGPSIVFFQTAGVEAMRAAILSRGGAASEIEKVNWIKMKMFQVSDPDGNTLWFGESFDVPYSPSPLKMLQQALPELPFHDVAAAIAYYRDVLGFKINYQQHDLGVMDRDKVTLLLIERTQRHTGIGSVGFYVENADDLYAELKGKGAAVQGEPVSYPWGLRNFQVLDLEGNRLTFSQTFE